MQKIISLIIAVISTVLTEDLEHKGPQTCGGRLRGPVGTIQTPNFPNPFPLPIKCRWIIEHDIVNGTISIYFTQQYSTSGLTFTEYIYYDESYKLGERKAFTVTEENITRVKWLQVQSPVLVVEFSLSRLEGTQLRALGLLSVFGFNMTYAIRPPIGPPDPPSCSAIECRLLGHCYASKDYQKFFCSCFEGYSGADCGVGPLCPKEVNMCNNGGTCRQMGPAAVSCICAPGYAGDNCEVNISSPDCAQEECLEACHNSPCDCKTKDSDFSTARFETKLQILDQNNSKNISSSIILQLTNYLESSNITLEDSIEVLNLSSRQPNGARTVLLRLWGAKKDAGAMRAALSRLAATRGSTNFKLLPASLHFDMQPAVMLHALTVNQKPEVWEGSEFILSCMAYGSPDINFTWYKDGVKINFNGTTRDIWTRTVAEDALGRRMSVLGISEARSIDSGRWSCAAYDAGRRRCKALWITILKPPDIRLLPSAITVNKGENVSITCLAGARRIHGTLGFSWAREKTLLPLAPGREVWEDLYPAGSVLKLYNIQKSAEYRCQVSSVAGTNAKSANIWALSEHDDACGVDTAYGVRWLITAPGAYATASCPPGYSGEITRFCEPKSSQHPVNWMLPDFSKCIANSLKDIYDEFIRVSNGYSWKSIVTISHEYGVALKKLETHPGEGAQPLEHISSMINYLLSAAGKPNDKVQVPEYLIRNLDMLLKHPDSFLDEEKIFNLQEALIRIITMNDYLDIDFSSFTVKSKPVKSDKDAHFSIQAVGSDNWFLVSAGLESVDSSGNVSVGLVVYKDLSLRLPSLRRLAENINGRELEYVIASQQIQIGLSDISLGTSSQLVTLLFTHPKNYTAIRSKFACALRVSSNPRFWRTETCEVRIPEASHVQCRCRGLGTFALLTVARSSLTETEKDLQGLITITIGISSALCLIAGGLQLLGLVPNRRTNLPVLLKAITAGSQSAAMLTLLECDNRQEEACPGPLGWVCAACWCAGCAALCAQPLLLQAELAGRTQNSSSVGLLIGVCTCSWLTARLWGGSPLQVGSAAQIVCSTGCVLLLALCFSLAMCALIRIKAITKKVSKDRRSHFRDRNKIIGHTLTILFTISATQVTGLAYVQPNERRTTQVLLLSSSAIVNGIAMIVCYVIRDEECLQALRRVFSFSSHRKWAESPDAGDTSLSLYIKQVGEVESRGGVGIDSSFSQSSADSYWRSPELESPNGLHRKSSPNDSRADIVRCVEFKDGYCPTPYPLITTHAVCDLIPHTASNQPEYIARVCLELNNPPVIDKDPKPMLTCSVDFQPYQFVDTAKETCSLCVQSDPDVSKISPPIKSCLKKTSQDFSSSVSLPSMEVKEEKSGKSDINQINREWNKAYSKPESDKVLNEISCDLDFLLNRGNVVSLKSNEIEEAPT